MAIGAVGIQHFKLWDGLPTQPTPNPLPFLEVPWPVYYHTRHKNRESRRNRIQLVVVMAAPHAIVITFPAQGHIIPLIALSHSVVAHGFKITFINSEFNHERVVASLSQNGGDGMEGIQMVSFPDGLAPGEDRHTSVQKKIEGIMRVMPECLEELIKQINASGGDRVTCVITDGGMGWVLEVVQKMGIRSAACWPASAALLALFMSIPEMIQDGIIRANGKTWFFLIFL